MASKRFLSGVDQALESFMCASSSIGYWQTSTNAKTALFANQIF